MGRNLISATGMLEDLRTLTRCDGLEGFWKSQREWVIGFRIIRGSLSARATRSFAIGSTHTREPERHSPVTNRTAFFPAIFSTGHGSLPPAIFQSFSTERGAW